MGSHQFQVLLFLTGKVKPGTPGRDWPKVTEDSGEGIPISLQTPQPRRRGRRGTCPIQPIFGAEKISHLRGRDLGFSHLLRLAMKRRCGPQFAALYNGAVGARSEWPRSWMSPFVHNCPCGSLIPHYSSRPRPTAGSAGLPAVGRSNRGQEVLHPTPDCPQGPRGHVPDLGRQRQRTRTGSP